ncbi:MAG: acetylglutamate kinase, partial [Candidatus Dormibacteraceae bacterium]
SLTSEFQDGLRVTDERTIEVVKMVLTGKVNPELVATLNRLGAQAIGMSGEDGPTIIAEGEDPRLGFVGRVTQIATEPIEALLSRGYIPVLASIGLGYDGNSYNINADTAAAEVAVALGAAKLILLTDVPGVLRPDGEVAGELRRGQAEAMIVNGEVSDGMIPKLKACIRSLDAVPLAHVIDGRLPHALLLELFTEAGVGTMVTP